MEENKYYVYVYLDPRKPGNYIYDAHTFDYEPFYIGKGYGYRFRQHLYESYNNRDFKWRKSGTYKNNLIRKIKKVTNGEPIIIKIKENITNEQSLKLEIDLIKIVGRKDQNKGPLLNKTNGGETNNGRIVSEKTKEKIRKNHADLRGKLSPTYGRKHTDEEKMKMRKNHVDVSGKNNPMYNRRGKNNPNYGRKHTDEEKMKMSKRLRGLKRSKEVIETMRNCQSNMKRIMIDDVVYKSIKEACRELKKSKSFINNRLNDKIKNEKFDNYQYI